MDWLSLFNSALTQRIANHPFASNRLKNALLYASESPGKRLRPRFVHESGMRFGLSEFVILRLAVAIECVHLFSLIHDDLPSLDNDDFRRGQPTVHRKFDEATALLAGDELLNFAYQIFAEILPRVSADAFGRALSYFAKCIGGEGMIGGQMLEVEILQTLTTPDLPLLLKIQDLKTGALFRASILIPALLAGESLTSDATLELKAFADAFGFAFQIADDLDDEIQDQAQAKKNILSTIGRSAAIDLALSQLHSNPRTRDFTASSLLIELIDSKR
jgi:farnesyl diphosphate synthase